MKKVVILAIILAVFAVTVSAENYLCITRSDPPRIDICEIPGPGYLTEDLHVLLSIDIPSYVSGLTFDGNYWWLGNSGNIYCFDEFGELITSFPNPRSDFHDLGYDGEYLWLVDTYGFMQLDKEGNAGPYGSFGSGLDAFGVTVIPEDEILVSGDGGDGYCEVYIVTFDGEFLGIPYSEYEIFTNYWPVSFAYDGTRVWFTYAYWEYSRKILEERLIGFTAYTDPYSSWGTYAVLEIDSDSNKIAICDHEHIGILESSLGKIKAYFADKEE